MKNGQRMMLVLVVCACGCAPAAGGSGDYAQGLLDRAQVLAAAAQVTCQSQPQADRVHIDDFTLCEYQPDGTGVTWSDNYTKVLTEDGRRQKQTISFNFLLPYNQVTVLLLEVIKPDGTTLPVDLQEHSKVVVRPSQISSGSYNPNSRVLEIGVPDLQVNDVVHLLTRHDTLRRVMPNTWDDFQVFESVAPIQHAVYEVHAPRQRPLCRMALKDPVEGTVTYRTYESGEQVVYRWEIAHVPGFCPEPGMPPSYTVVQRLLVSTLSDWSAISRWYWGLCEPHLKATTPEMQALVDKLTEGVTERRKKIEVLFYWVSRQVQYLGVATGNESPGWEPGDVGVTFAQRHGVCRDKAAVLVALLRLAGLEAYPVLMDLGPARDTEVPLTSFRHAVAGVRQDDGSYLLMDCTDENTRELQSSDLHNLSYLVACPEGETLRTSPAVPAAENTMSIETTGHLDARGTLSAETVLRLQGITDHVHRGYLSRRSPEERRHHFESLLHASVPSATLTEFNLRPANMQDTSEPLSVHLRYFVEDFLAGGDTTLMMPLPHLGTKLVFLNTGVDRTALPERHFPFQISSTCGVRETLHLMIDPAAASILSAPGSEPIENEAVSWKHTFTPEPNALREQSEFLVKMVEFSPSQYRQLRDSLCQIERNERRLVLLTRPLRAEPPPADVVVLDDWCAYDVTDARNWRQERRVVKKVCTYKGQKEAAELRLSYNPAWEEVKLIRATVARGEQVKECGEEACHLVDAPWVSSAPRYSAGKVLVVHLPGVEVGSVVTYEYEQVSRDHPFFAATHLFRGFYPIHQQAVQLTTPATLVVQTALDNDGRAAPRAGQALQTGRAVVESVENRADKIVRRWRTQEQASVRQESAMPPLEEFNPVLRVTTGDWGTYAKKVLGMLSRAARGQPGAAQRARELVQRAQNPRDRIIAIRDFVAANIRPAGPAFGELPLTAVSAADQTLAEGYGHAADRAVLLFGMLEAAGLEPEFTLVSSGPPVEQLQRPAAQYPDVKTFDNVLVSVPCGSAKVYLNDTSQYDVLGTTPAEGHLALPLARGRTEIISVAEENRDVRSCAYRLTLTEQGDVRLAVTQSSYGLSFAERHRFFAEMAPRERDHYACGLAAGISRAAVVEGSLVTDFESYPGIESFHVRAEEYAIRDGEFLYFEVPLWITGLFNLPSGRRENPFYQAQSLRSRVSATIELPRALPHVVLMPGPREWFLPGGGHVRISMTKQDRHDDQPACLCLVQEIDLHPCILDVRECARLQEVERQLSLIQGHMVLLTRSE